MSSASLAVAIRPHPEATRVAALSAAIALNLAALLILIRPLAPQALALANKLVAVPQVVFLEPPPKVPPPPAIDLKPLPHPPTAPVHVQPRPDPAPPMVPSNEGTQPMPATTKTSAMTIRMMRRLPFLPLPLPVPDAPTAASPLSFGLDRS